MEQPEYVVIFITANSTGEAQQIAGLLLEKRKAACVNIIPEVDSRFWWEGKFESAQESLLVIKTRSSLLPEIINLVKGIHSNTVPEIVALPIIGGNQDYLDWITRETL
ncbi:divalent-cation tolerance protein CutA [Chloroflexota bacterium]